MNEDRIFLHFKKKVVNRKELAIVEYNFFTFYYSVCIAPSHRKIFTDIRLTVLKTEPGYPGLTIAPLNYFPI